MWFYQVYDVTEYGAPKLRKGSETFEVERLVDKEEPDENIWGDQPITLAIVATKDGIGLDYESPAGYSSYTYDPDTTRAFYYTKDFDWFLRNALDADMREMLTANDLENIKQKLEELQK